MYFHILVISFHFLLGLSYQTNTDQSVSKNTNLSTFCTLCYSPSWFYYLESIQIKIFNCTFNIENIGSWFEQNETEQQLGATTFKSKSSMYFFYPDYIFYFDSQVLSKCISYKFSTGSSCL